MRTSLMRRARRLLAAAHPPLTEGPRALTRRAALLAGAATLAACASVKAPKKRESIAIVGAGVAGLTLAHRLAGRADCVIYESSNRVGGRMFTRRNFNRDGQFCELGGELVDEGHTALRALAQELGVGVQSLVGEGPSAGDLYHFGGQEYRARDMIDPATGLGAFRPIAEKIAADRAGLLDADDNWTDAARALDRTSLKAYLDAFRAAAPAFAVDLLDVAYEGEFGRPTGEQSALNLVDFIGVEAGAFDLFGESDEGARIAGGSSSLVEALARAVDGRAPVLLGHALVGVRLQGDGVGLDFDAAGGRKSVVADRAALTLPFTRLRSVAGLDGLGLPPAQREAIAELGYGRNAKLMVAATSRPWLDAEKGRFDGAIYTDNGLQLLWETSRGQAGDGGVLTNFLSPPRSDMAEADLLRTLKDTLATIAPTTAASLDLDTHAAFYWNRHPHTLGSYSCALVGQYTRLPEAVAPPAAGGRIHFAGEHASVDHQGFMNGAIESAETAAKAILAAG